MTIVDSFLEKANEEDPRVSKYIEDLDEEGLRNLKGVLDRFDASSRGDLLTEERMLAYRVFSRLRKIDTEVLITTNRVLDYLDLNANAKLDAKEMELCVDILETFAKADSSLSGSTSDDATLSPRELKLLYAVLRHLDADDSMALEANERAELRRALAEPAAFLEEQKRVNPLFREALKG